MPVSSYGMVRSQPSATATLSSTRTPNSPTAMRANSPAVRPCRIGDRVQAHEARETGVQHIAVHGIAADRVGPVEDHEVDAELPAASIASAMVDRYV